ncbi:hypothetical protein PInf_022072 [Phytophthora infestans]|nr:hypothetical protein PInf_022072 [Phytophthora infestans]
MTGASDTDRQDAEASRSCQRADSSAYSETMLRCGNTTGVGLCPACGPAAPAASNAEGRRAVRASTVVVPKGIHQVHIAGNKFRKQRIGLRRPTFGDPSVGNKVPRKVTQTITDKEVAVCASGVGNRVPHNQRG